METIFLTHLSSALWEVCDEADFDICTVNTGHANDKKKAQSSKYILQRIS